MRYPYRGITIGVAIKAAFSTVSPVYHLYSALGNYLGPASTDRNYQCAVREVRNTKTFATRHVEVSQLQDDGSKRLCLFLTADFQTAEPETLLVYSREPRNASFLSLEDGVPLAENRQNLLDRGAADPKMMQLHSVVFALAERYTEYRYCPDGMLTQTMTGFAKKGIPTTQDSLPLPDRTSGDWFRNKHPMTTSAEHVSALAFLLDGAVSFLALAHNGQSLADAGAQSSLDFAFRVFENGVNLNEWLMREMTTATGGNGRTFAGATVWDREGRMVAEMTQQCILRPQKASKM